MSLKVQRFKGLKVARLLLLNLLTLLTLQPFNFALPTFVQAEQDLTPDQEAGKKVYQKWCIHCHGEQGDGQGPAADFLRPRPRDFRNGLFKIRSTGSGKLPTDRDLFDVITNGMPGTAMPAWGGRLKERERSQLVQYIKTFSRRFARSKEAPEPIAVGPRLTSNAESIQQGRELFQKLECFKCHGNEGRANGPSAPELTDDWNYPIRPANLTKPWNFRGGHAPEDLYRRLQGGLAGSPMPAFADSLNNDQTWHLIHYLQSLWPDPTGDRPPLKVVLRARRVERTIPALPADEFWKGEEAFNFPLIGQVIENPRLFTPSVEGLRVQAAYNSEGLALRLVWDDPTDSRPDPTKGFFEDAVAVQFPIEIPAGVKRPFFLMGDAEIGVQLLRWSNASGGIVTEMNGNGLARLAVQPADSQKTTAIGEYADGQYRVVLKRPLKTDDPAHDIQLEPGRFIPVAFFVWDGSNSETGSQMAISHWYYFLMEPPLPTAVYLYPVAGVGVAVSLEWWVIRRLRRRKPL